MVAAEFQNKNPFSLVVTGEAETWLPALEMIVGPQWLTIHKVSGEKQLLKVVESGLADAAVLDDASDWTVDVLRLLRMIRRFNQVFPVVVISSHSDRRWLEDALRLAVFSVVVRPLELEELLRQIQRMMARLDRILRQGDPDP
jgi:DNA-binding NtrC family response regulator